MGKSGFIAKKVPERGRPAAGAAADLPPCPPQVSQTLVSTGTRAIFLAPVDALHGDIGIVQQGDFVVMLSRSGAPPSAWAGRAAPRAAATPPRPLHQATRRSW